MKYHLRQAGYPLKIIELAEKFMVKPFHEKMSVHQNQKVLCKAFGFAASGKCKHGCFTIPLGRPLSTCEPRDRTASGTLGLLEVVMSIFPAFCTPSDSDKALKSQSFPKAWLPLLVQGAWWPWKQIHAKALRSASHAYWSWLLHDAMARNLLAVLLTLLS